MRGWTFAAFGLSGAGKPETGEFWIAAMFECGWCEVVLERSECGLCVLRQVVGDEADEIRGRPGAGCLSQLGSC